MWRSILDPLQLQLALLSTCQEERLIITPSDVKDGSLMILASTQHFRRAEVYIRADGLAFEFDKYTCGPRPAVVMTMDSEVGRMGVGASLPFCGHVVPCTYEGDRDRHTIFSCTCPYEACHDIAFSFSQDAIDPSRQLVYFEDMHVAILE